jgi:hypothetical protein
LTIFFLRKSPKLVFTPVEKIMSFTMKAFGTCENSGGTACSIVGLALMTPAKYHIESGWVAGHCRARPSRQKGSIGGRRDVAA